MKLKIAVILETGQFQVQIPRDFNVTPSVMSNLWEHFKGTESIERKPGQGHPRSLKANKDRYLPITARDNKSAITS